MIRRFVPKTAYQQLVSALVLALAASAADAATYYVKPTGNDASNGLSDSTAWRSLAKVNSFAFQPGDDVLLLSGSTWEDAQIRIDWSGTTQNPSIVGSYWFDGSREVAGIGQAGRPEINGTYTRACHSFGASVCEVPMRSGQTNPAAVPSSFYDALVAISGSNVIVRDLALRDSAAGGVATTNNSATNIVIDNLDVEFVYAIGAFFRNQFVTIKNSRFDQITLQRVAGIDGSGDGPVSILIRNQTPAYALVENNVFTNLAGEGLGCLQSSHCVFRGNTVANVNRPSFYLDNTSDSVFEQNVIVGGAYQDAESSQSRGSFNAAFQISVEPYGDADCSATHDSVRNLIRNNLVANVRTAIGFDVFSDFNRNGTSCNPTTRGFKVGAEVLGNTFVAISETILKLSQSAENIHRIDIANNIFAKSSASCGWPSGIQSVAQIRSNLFENLPGNLNCRGASYVSGDADLGNFAFTTADAGRIPPVSAFTPGERSAARGAGLVILGSAFDVSALHPQYPTASNPCRGVDPQKLALDYSCNRREQMPNIGALVQSNAGGDTTSLLLVVD